MGLAVAPPPSTAPERVLGLPGARNLRDLGGYPTEDGRRTRWRTLYRADSLHRLSPESQSALLATGVRTVVDLRRDDEVEESPSPFASSDDVRYVRISLQDEPLDKLGGMTSLEDLYRSILEGRRSQIVDVFRTLLNPGALPAVFHCTAGKDRTGIVAALALGAVGVPEAHVVADYVLSVDCLGDTFLDDARAFVAKRGWSWEQMGFLWSCTPDLILGALRHMDEQYGGTLPYLLAAGISEGEIAALRTYFTD